MDVFVQIVVEGNLGDGAVSQKVARSLAELGLAAHLQGHKGTFSLPRGTFAGTFPAPGADARQAVTSIRADLIDRISERLEAAGFRGTFFMSVAHAWGWGIRPVPRHPKTDAGAPLEGDAREVDPTVPPDPVAHHRTEADGEG